MAFNDSWALFNFYLNYPWNPTDFTAFQAVMIGMMRDALGATFGSALITGGTITNGSGLSIDVAAYVAIGDDGYLHVKNAATNNIALAAAHATLDRLDLVVARTLITDNTTIARPTSPYDNVFLKELQQTQVVVITGTPSATPSYPAKTAHDVILGGVSVLHTATSPSSIDMSIADSLSTNALVNQAGSDRYHLQRYGDGSDGNVTISSGTTTLTRDMYYQNLTIKSTGALLTNGFRVFVAGTLDLTHCNTGCIQAQNFATSAGGSTATGAGGLGGQPVDFSAPKTKTVGAGMAGGAGGTVGGAGDAAGTSGNNGGNGGVGGSGVNSGAAGGSKAIIPIRRPVADLIAGSSGQMLTGLIRGGAGGGGGSEGTTKGGGGGGAGGDVIYIAARAISRDSVNTNFAAIMAEGGAGGTTPTDTVHGGGGGGGGGGGWIFILYSQLVGTSVTNMIDVSGGAGANGSNGTTGGGGGTGGESGVVALFSDSTATLYVNQNPGIAGGPPSGGTGGTGGAGGVGFVTF